MCVIESDHVVAEGNHALAGEADAARGNAAVLRICHAAILPMTMRIENGRKGAFAVTERAIQVSGQMKAGHRLEIHLFDGVAVALDFVENDRVECRFLRYGPETATDKNLLADIARPVLPFTT